MNSAEGSLPRPLKAGEFYCHNCKEYVPMDKHSEHSKLCRQRKMKEGGKA